MTEQWGSPPYSQAFQGSTDDSGIHWSLTWNLDIYFVQGGYNI